MAWEEIIKLDAATLAFAVSGGIIPALLWLWFWLKEDNKPEPKKIILKTFIGGMIAIFFALVFEYLASFYLSGIILILAWSFIEEVFKYLAAWRFAMTKKCFDEPVDAMIYMVTAALGFAALENIFFILKTFSANGLLSSFITGNLRFIGATLLHTATSAIVGASIAFSFFHKEIRKYNAIGGLILAGTLHFIFNYLIIKSNGGDGNIIKILIPLWWLIIIIIFIFERVKKIKT